MKEVRTVQGVITKVMESWPLQLVVQSGEDSTHVALTFQTTITRNGKNMTPSDLHASQLVKIEGASISLDALTANWIEILEM
jgi:hypothetical protein